MTLFYISGHRKFKTKSRKVMKYEKTLVNFKPFFEFFDIWVPITFRDKELMVWNFEFPSFLLCPTIPFLPFWAIRKTGQIISIWTQFQQMLKIIEIAHILYFSWFFCRTSHTSPPVLSKKYFVFNFEKIGGIASQLLVRPIQTDIFSQQFNNTEHFYHFAWLSTQQLRLSQIDYIIKMTLILPM